MINYLLFGLLGFVILFWFSFLVIMVITTPHRRAQEIITARRKALATIPALEHEDKLWRLEQEPVNTSAKETLYHHVQMYDAVEAYAVEKENR